MFEILYNALVCTYNFNETSVSGGMIATFTSNRTVGICKPNQLPIGFFMEDYPTENYYASSVTNFSQVRIAIGIGEYRTDIHEEGFYNINDLLYCNPEGKLTNNPIYIRNPIVGIVNCVEDNVIGFLTVFDNLESIYIPDIKKEIKPPSKSKRKFNRYTALKRSKK